MDHPVLMEEAGFWRIIKLKQFRRTEGVSFDIVPMEVLPRIDGIDRVLHKRRAISPVVKSAPSSAGSADSARSALSCGSLTLFAEERRNRRSRVSSARRAGVGPCSHPRMDFRAPGNVRLP